MNLIKEALKNKKVRAVMRERKIKVSEFKAYGYVNHDFVNDTYIIGMGKFNGIYDYLVIENVNLNGE